LDFFTVIIHTPDVGITVLPEAGTYHKHTDQTFSFSVTPPPLTPEELLLICSNGEALPLPEAVEGAYSFVISPNAAYDTFTIDINFTEPTPPEKVGGLPAGTASVAYRNGLLQVQGLDGYQLHLVSLAGVRFATFSATETSPAPFTPAADYWIYPIRLPAGVYILYAERNGQKRGAFKFAVH
ncbi:MAG: hypothetical protein LBB27_00245, partial [Tannerellaceae bacterium]|jgi:hypothetical protein|nr:hypothetical protein [Tannerellaceae bacterium]